MNDGFANKKIAHRYQHFQTWYLWEIFLICITLFFDLLFNIQECLGILVARCASCNCMPYFNCVPLQVYTPFRSAQNHCPPDNVRLPEAISY